MSQLQSSVGLISGLNITQTVNNLMAVSSGPVNALTATNTQLQSQDTAFTQLSAQLLALQADAKALKSSSLYTSRSASSSDSTAMTATVTGTPSLGTYQFTPLQVVQTQQLLSNGFSSDTTSLGGGQISFRFGANLDQSAALDTLNGGAGFTPGKIQITDRSGATATIDLSTAQTIGDVINDINNNGTVNVTASARREPPRLDRQYRQDRRDGAGPQGSRGWQRQHGRLARLWPASTSAAAERQASAATFSASPATPV